MKQFFVAIIIAVAISTLGVKTIQAQIMGFQSASPNNSEIKNQQQEEQTGKSLLDQLNKGKTTCQTLVDADFEKIGEYFMGQVIGETSKHIAMDNSMKSMIGEQGEEQMHIAWGKRGSGCDNNSSFLPRMGGGFNMIGGYYGMMNGGFGIYAVFAWLTWVLITIALVLGIVWLWKQIKKK